MLNYGEYISYAKEKFVRQDTIMKQPDSFLQKTPVVWIGALICCALWGSAFPCIKLGYEWMQIASGDIASQILYAGLRFTLAGILTILIGSVAQRRILFPTVSAMPRVLWLCMLQTVAQYLFFYIGLAHTTGVKASIIEGMNVFVAVLVAALLFHQEKLTLRKLLGCVIGFLGVVCVNLNGLSLDAPVHWNGEFFIFLSTVAYAFSSVYMKKYSKDHNPVMLSGYQFLLGGIIMSACGLLAGGQLHSFSGRSIAMLFWLATVSAVAYSIWSILLKYNPVSKVAVFGFMNPVFGFLLSSILLNEDTTISFITIGSLILVCAGIFIVNKPDKTTPQ